MSRVGTAWHSVQTIWRGRFIPCVHVVAGLCVVPVLTVFVTSWFFHFQDQAKEVLFTFSEPDVEDIKLPNSVGLARLVYFSLAQLALGCVVWYSARLLVTINKTQTIDQRFPKKPSIVLETLKHAQTWAPRALGCLSVVGLSLAVILNRAVALKGVSTTVLVLTTLVSPLLFLRFWSIANSKLKGLLMAGLTAALAIDYAFMIRYGDRSRYSLFLGSELFIPTMFLAAVVYRRTWCSKICNEPERSPAAEPDSPWMQVLIHVGMLFVAVGIILWLGDARLGPAPIVLLLAAAVCSLFSLIAMGTRVVFLTTSGRSLVVFIPVVLLVWRCPGQVGQESLMVPPHPLEQKTSHPLANDANLYAVNAYGGGLRAAVYTGSLLATLDDRSCGSFGRQLTGLSGVSGGSLGIAMYLSIRQDFVAGLGWPKSCKPGWNNPDQLHHFVVGALARDHLSPMLAALATRDVVHPLSPATRGQALLMSWHKASLEVMNAPEYNGTFHPVGLARPLGELTGGADRDSPVCVFFNTTDAQKGRAAWYSNAVFLSDDTQPGSARSQKCLTSGKGRIVGRGVFQFFGSASDPFSTTQTVGVAVLDSARFPIISPPGYFEEASQDFIFLDGGYVDNSGANTLRDELDAAPLPKPMVLSIDGNPGPPDPACQQRMPSPTTLGIEAAALDYVRSANATVAQAALVKSLGANKVSYLVYKLNPSGQLSVDDKCKQSNQGRYAPLGWYMSLASEAGLELSVHNDADTVCRNDASLCGAEKVIADTNVSSLNQRAP